MLAMGEEEQPFEIDPAYENLAAPKYFDFAKVEQEQDIAAVEAWFEFAPPDAVSPQVLSARAAGRSLAPMDVSPFVNEPPSATEKKSQQLPTETKMLEDLPFAFPAPAVAAAETTPGLPGGDKAGKGHRTHSMHTRSITKCNQESPMDSDDVAMAKTPESALLAKDLYSQLCTEAGSIPKHPGPSRLGPAGRQPKLPVPELPKLAAARQTRKTPLYDHEQPLQANKRRKLEDGRLKQILNPRGPVLPARSTAPLTIPKEFHFRTEERVRNHNASNKENAGGKGPYVPLMEAVQKFQNKTPKRFHTVPPNQNVPVVERTELQLTVPKEPLLETALRSRPARIKSQDEQEEEELAKVPKFKARTLDPKVLKGYRGLAACSVPKQPLTETQEFHLETAERALRHAQAHASESQVTIRENPGENLLAWDGSLTVAQEPNLETSRRMRPFSVKSREELEAEEMDNMPKFKARPLNKRIMESVGELGVPRVPKRPVTEPKDPMLATDQRALKRQAQANPEGTHPHQIFYEEVAQWENSLTQPKPFPLITEERGKYKEHQLQQRVAAEEERLRESRVVRAQPLPATTDMPQVLKKPPPPPPTEPQPFEMPGLRRHAEEQRKLAAEQAERERQLAAQHMFQAQPNLSKLIPPFVPEKSRQPLTQIQAVKLHIDNRAVERAEFNKQVQQKHAQAEQMRAKFEAERKAEEERQVKAMRKEMVPHARPLPSFSNPFVPTKSNAKLTKPVSPALGRSHQAEKQRHASTSTAAYELRSRMR